MESVYSALPETGGWSVHFAIPSRNLDAPIRRSLRILVAGGVVSLMLAGGLGALIARELALQRRQEAARASLAVRASEYRAAVAVDAADLGTWCWESTRDEVTGSSSTARWLDLPAQAADGGQWTTAVFLASVHPDDRANVRRAVDACLGTGGALEVDFRTGPREGSARWLRAVGRASEGVAAAVIHGVIADVDAEKRSAAERRDLLRRLGVAQEDEQRRIARELHDQVGQTVTGLSLALKSLERSAARHCAPAAMLDQVRWLQHLAGTIGRDIHRASSDLRPTALDDLGLRRALAAHAAEWSRRFGLHIDVEWHGSDERLPAEVETALYRVVQEAITNVVKHAGARTVGIVVDGGDLQGARLREARPAYAGRDRPPQGGGRLARRPCRRLSAAAARRRRGSPDRGHFRTARSDGSPNSSTEARDREARAIIEENNMNRITGLTAALLLATSPVALAQTATTPPAPAATQQPGSTAGMDRGYLDQSEVEDRLEERDFSDISLELKDGAFSGTADRWSKEVDVRVDARTGRVMEPNRLTADQVEQKLEDEGYENVSDVREAGDEFTARAERFGEESDLRVSAANGNVLDPRELKGEQIVELLEDEDWSDIKIFEREDDYGNYRAVADKDDDTFLLEIRPINGEIVAERAENERDDG